MKMYATQTRGRMVSLDANEPMQQDQTSIFEMNITDQGVLRKLDLKKI